MYIPTNYKYKPMNSQFEKVVLSTSLVEFMTILSQNSQYGSCAVFVMKDSIY